VTQAALDESGWKARLDAGVHELGFDLEQSQLDLLWRYGVMLRERNAHVNLTSIVSPEGILTLHMLDSLSVVPHLGAAARVIDVGTGGGFPGVPRGDQQCSPSRDGELTAATAGTIPS